MKNKPSRKITKILLGILVALILLNGIWVVYDIRKDIQSTKEDIMIKIQSRYEYIGKEIDKIKTSINSIYIMLEIMDITDNIILKTLNTQNQKINLLPNKIQLDKTIVEYKLKRAVVIIYNKTVGLLGSGVTIKYKDKFYILSAGHMVDKNTDLLSFGENTQEIGELEIIKHDYTTLEQSERGDFTKGTDLLLLQ